MLIDIDGSGEVEITATLYTLVIYEQEFHSDLIKDVFGNAGDGGSSDKKLFDFTTDNWGAEVKALWAMLKTANELADDRGEIAPKDRVPQFRKWVKGIGKVNMKSISDAVFIESMDGFFHSGAAASE